MGTRSLIQVNSKKENRTITLYKHWDGYPSDNLNMLLEAFKNEDIETFLNGLAEYYKRPLTEMIELDASYIELPWNAKDYSQHGDLEYFYVVDFDLKNINIYGNGYDTESNHFKRGRIEPMSEVECYVEEAQPHYEKMLNDVIKKLAVDGISINNRPRLVVPNKIGMSISSSNDVESIDFLLNGARNPKTTTDKFRGVSSQSIIDCYEEAGLVVRDILRPGARNKENLPFNKHIVRLTTPENLEALQNGTKSEIVEIIVVNNNNNRGSISIMMGIFRFICSNGIIAGDKLFNKKVRHDGATMTNLLNALITAKERMHQVDSVIEKLKSIELCEADRLDFKKMVREKFIVPKLKTGNTTQVNVTSMLNPVRVEDQRNDAWTTFNRFQEYLIKGGIKYSKLVEVNDELTRTNGTTREIKGVDSVSKINAAFFDATLEHFNIAA